MAVILFNKPYGVLSQFSPEAGHRALNEFGFPEGVYAAGRLDHDSEGALLLTDDGKLIKDCWILKRTILVLICVQVEGLITPEAIQS
jgi:23S rRNA pseudouridine2457 synthase